MDAITNRPVPYSDVVDLIADGGWNWVTERPDDNRISDGRGGCYRVVRRTSGFFLEPMTDHRRAAAADHDD